jgi:hypothetical protein
MNANSGKNLTDARAVSANDVRTALDTGAAFGGVTDIAPSRRMTATCTWGVSDPCGAGVGRRRGQPSGGRSRPTVDMLSYDSGVDCDTGGTKRRR